MFCPNCGEPLKDGVKFCPNCGEKVPAAFAPEPEVQPEPVLPVDPVVIQAPEPPVESAPVVPRYIPAQPAPEKPAKKKSRLGLILACVIGAVLVGLALVLVLVILPEQKRAKTYEQASALLEQKDYAGAEAIYRELGEYKDSPAQVAYAERGIAYEKAKDAMGRSDYREALTAFEKDPTFADAAALKDECQTVLDFDEAAALFEKGDYEQALSVLEGLKKIDRKGQRTKEAAELETKAVTLLDFEKASALFEKGDYEQTLALLDDLKAVDSYGLKTAEAADLELRARTLGTYEKAAALYEKGNYDQALTVLDELNKIDTLGLRTKENADLAKKCTILSDYNAAYALAEDGELEKAIEALDRLAAFDTEGFNAEKTAALAQYCRNMLKFREAYDLYEKGEYEQAIAILDTDELREFDGAPDVIAASKRKVGEKKIVDLMKKGSYKEALDLLNSGYGDGMEDLNERIEECENGIKYAEAEALLGKKKNYDAYKIFTALGDFKDAKAKAKSCIVAKPKTKETYHNKSYKGSKVRITINAPKDGNYTYMKIYAYKNKKATLVSCAFIAPGGKVKVNLPAGTYIIKQAYGSGNWYGTTDMFGDEGWYYRIYDQNGNNTFTYKNPGSGRYWVVTWTLRTSTGNTGSESEPRGTF